MIGQAQRRLSLMGGSSELAAMEAALAAAEARGLATRIVSIGAAPAARGQVAAFPDENVSAPTRFLLVITDAVRMLLAMFPPNIAPSAVYGENPILAHVLTSFLNTEYYIVRASNKHPALMRELLAQVLEPEDRERYAGVLRFLSQQGAE